MGNIKLSVESRTYLTEDLKICRVLNGMWQVSGAHGYINKDNAIKNMLDYANHGFVTWDLADHYGPAEDFVKLFRKQLIKENQTELIQESKFFTKWVPRPGKMTKKIVKEAIDISRRRMGMNILDMLQFHWWDYENHNYINALEYLDELREENIIKHLALTNFDTDHLTEIISLGIPIVSNQVQYSLIDRRPERRMAEICKKYNIKLLAYGTLGGGLFTERFYKKPEPRGTALYTASLSKYKNIMDLWGDWALFQKLLNVLKEIADKYHVSIANIAVRYVLEHEFVGGAIIGVRLGISEHLKETSDVFRFSLDKEDFQKIEDILRNSNDLMEIIGDCGDEYR